MAGGVEVRRASGPGTNAKRTRYSLLIDKRKRNDWMLGVPDTWLGVWHTHVAGGTEPSSGDLAAWRAGFERCRREGSESYVGLILTAQAGNWVRPEIRAWLVSAGESEPRICRARLELAR